MLCVTVLRPPNKKGRVVAAHFVLRFESRLLVCREGKPRRYPSIRQRICQRLSRVARVAITACFTVVRYIAVSAELKKDVLLLRISFWVQRVASLSAKKASRVVARLFATASDAFMLMRTHAIMNHMVMIYVADHTTNPRNSLF